MVKPFRLKTLLPNLCSLVRYLSQPLLIVFYTLLLVDSNWFWSSNCLKNYDLILVNFKHVFLQSTFKTSGYDPNTLSVNLSNLSTLLSRTSSTHKQNGKTVTVVLLYKVTFIYLLSTKTFTNVTHTNFCNTNSLLEPNTQQIYKPCNNKCNTYCICQT